jgi:hypothetical protein
MRTCFEAYMRKRIALKKLRESTRERYLQTLKQFEAYLSEENVTLVEDMTKSFIESFKVWRLNQIQKRKEARGGDRSRFGRCYPA